MSIHRCEIGQRPSPHGAVDICRSVSLTGALFAAALSLLTLFAIFTSPVSAAEIHTFSKSFGTGELALAEHSGAAVNRESGNLYVADTGNGRVAEYSGGGAFIRGFGALNEPTFIAVDNSAGASKGDVYVADTSTATVAKFDATGTPVTSWGTGGVIDGSTTPKGTFKSIFGIAVDSTGALVVYAEPAQGGTFDRFAQDGSFLDEVASPYGPRNAGIGVDSDGDFYVARAEEPGPTAKVGPSGAGLVEFVDPGPTSSIATDGTDVYVSHADHVSHYDASDALLESFGGAELTGGAGVGIAADGTAYVADSATDQVYLYKTALVPNVKSEEATGIGRTAATLHGMIGAAGGPEAKCRFQYTTQAKYEAEGFAAATIKACTPPGPFTGTTENAVTASLTGLQVGTSYRFRLVGENANGANPTDLKAGSLAFETAPAVRVEPTEATEVLRGSAALNGTVNPEGVEVEACEFEYAARATFEAEGFASATKKPCAEPDAAELGEGNEPVAVHAKVVGLAAATEYLFRLVGQNSFGTTRSFELSFNTKVAVNVEIGTATEINPTTATLNGAVDPERASITACEFEYATLETFNTEGFGSAIKAECEPNAAGIGAGNGPVPVKANLTSLAPNTKYAFRLSAESAFGTSSSPEAFFETHGPPTLGEVALRSVTPTTATIETTLDPHGEPTTLQVEYVTEAQFESSEYAGATAVPVPALEVGSGVEAITVTQELIGLTPETTYHFRVVLANPAGPPVVSADRTFATVSEPGPPLPDDRAYELVSPAQKGGEVILLERAEHGILKVLGGTCGCSPGFQFAPSPVESSLDGDSILYLGQPFHSGLAPGGNQYFASRGPSGWGSTVALTPPAFEKGTESEYVDASADLTRFIASQTGPLALSPATPTREGRPFGDLYVKSGPTGPFQPLVTVEPPQRSPGANTPNKFAIQFAGANSGDSLAGPLTHVIFLANDALTAEIPGVAPEAPEVGPSECENFSNCNLYEWDEGQLRLVNVLPNGEALSFADYGGGPSGEESDYDNAISKDGSRIFWSSQLSGQVYVRIDGQRTEEIKDPGSYLRASADGSRVLLADGCLYDLASEECTYDLTDDETGASQGGFQGILGAAEDLSRVYFVDTSVLTGANAEGKAPLSSNDNLYAWHEGSTIFVGALAAADNELNEFSGFGDWKRSTSHRPAQVTSDGRFLGFMSSNSLTGYDNTRADGKECLHHSPAVSLRRCYEVFEYDSASGNLNCVSCNPSGSRPLDGSNLNLQIVSRFVKAGAAQPRSLTSSGRMFFESRDALTPADRNGSVQDLYEWEPQGVGSCVKAQGCIALISSGEGTAAEEAYFVSASASGDDVFFDTRRRLLPRDKDSFMDLYDARVNGGLPEEELPACNEGALPCKASPILPPGSSAPGSSSFTGPGNPKRKSCKKGFVRKHRKCVKQQKHRKKSRHHRGHKAARGPGSDQHRTGGSK